MSRMKAKQPNGKYAILEQGVDRFVAHNVDDDFLLNHVIYDECTMDEALWHVLFSHGEITPCVRKLIRARVVTRDVVNQIMEKVELDWAILRDEEA